MASILSRLSSLVPDFRPFRTPAARGTARPRPNQDERIPTRAGIGRTWFLPYADSTATDDTPDIRAAMRKMLRDPYIKSAWLSQLLSVLSQPIQVHVPKGKKNRTDQGRADFVRHCLEHAQDGMLGVGTAILMNHGSDGYTVSEKVWQTDARGKYANKVTLRALKPKDLDEHGRLIGDEHNNVTGVWSSRTNETYPITDFVYTRYLHTFDEPMGMAAFRPSYGAYWARDTVRKLRIIHKEKNLDGLLMGTYEDPADKGPLEAALARARSSTWLSIPAGVRVEMLSKSQAAEGDYKSFDESLREESLVGIALAHLHILQGGVSDARGNTKVHKAVADLGPWLLTYIIQYAINRQIVPDLIDYNYGYSDEYPQVTLGGVSNAEVIELLQVLEGAQRAGFKPSKSYYATELTIQEADQTDPDDLLTPPSAAPPGGGGMDLGGMLGGMGGGDPFGGGGGGGGLPPGPPALPPAPTAGGEFGAFRECGPKGGYEEFSWDDWTQEAGGKWKSPGGRVLSDAVFQRLRGKRGGAKPAAAAPASPPPAPPPPPPSPPAYTPAKNEYIGLSYTLTPKEYKGLKARLTIAKKSNDPAKVQAEVRRAKAIFDAKGYPDDWASWDRAADDAIFAARRNARSSWFGETGHIETFGWDDWKPRDQYMVSPGGRVLKRDTWERMKARTPQGGGATTANGRTTPPAGRTPQPADRQIQARLARIRGTPAETLREVEGDVRAAAAELATSPPQPAEVIDLVTAATPGLDAATQQQLGTKLAGATSAGTPEGVKSGFRKLAEWAASLTGRAAVWAVRGLLTVAKKLLFNTTAGLIPPGTAELPGKVARTFPSVLKYVGVLALSAGIFAASIAAPILLPAALMYKLGVAAVTLPAGAAWVTWGMRKALRGVGREAIEKWTGRKIPDYMKANPPPDRGAVEMNSEGGAPQAGEEIALAGKDGKRAAELMGKSQKLGRDVLARVTEQAVARLLADADPLDNTVLFTDEELKEIADSLAATTAAADLLGRSRVRRMAVQADEGMRAFAEELRPTCPKCGQKGTFARTTGDANAICDKCGKFNAPLPTAKFSESGTGPDPFDVFAEPPEALPPADAVDYFRRLVPSINLSPERYAPLLGRQAFTLAVAADQSLLNRVKMIILDQIEAGRRPQAVADIQDELDAAGVTPRNPQYSEMVFRTNMNDAYMQGFAAEMADPGIQEVFPAWEYHAILDGRERERHGERNGLMYQASVPFAEVRGTTASDVCNCRCSASPVSKWDVQKRLASGERIQGV